MADEPTAAEATDELTKTIREGSIDPWAFVFEETEGFKYVEIVGPEGDGIKLPLGVLLEGIKDEIPAITHLAEATFGAAVDAADVIQDARELLSAVERFADGGELTRGNRAPLDKAKAGLKESLAVWDGRTAAAK